MGWWQIAIDLVGAASVCSLAAWLVLLAGLVHLGVRQRALGGDAA